MRLGYVLTAPFLLVVLASGCDSSGGSSTASNAHSDATSPSSTPSNMDGDSSGGGGGGGEGGGEGGMSSPGGPADDDSQMMDGNYGDGEGGMSSPGGPADDDSEMMDGEDGDERMNSEGGYGDDDGEGFDGGEMEGFDGGGGGGAGRRVNRPPPPPPPKDLPGLARDALRAGDSQKAANYLAAHSLLGPVGAQTMDSTKWVPGLNRPAVAVQWGIAIQLTGNVKDGDLKPIGSTQQFPGSRNRRGGSRGGGLGYSENTGGGGGSGGGGDDFGSAGAGGFGDDDGAGGTEGFGSGGGGGGGRNRGGAPSELTRTTGELGEQIYQRLAAGIQRGSFGAILQEAAKGSGGGGRGGFGGQAGAGGGFGAGDRGRGSGGFGAEGSGAGGIGGDSGSGASGGGRGSGGFGADGGGAGGFGGDGGAGGFGGDGGAGGFGGDGMEGDDEGMDGFGGGQQRRGGQVAVDGVGITLLTEGTAGKQLADAKQRKLDALIVLRVKVSRNPRTGVITNEVLAFLMDVRTGSRLPVARMSKLTNIAVQRARDDDKKDPLGALVDTMFKYIDENLTLQSLPASVTREDRIERVRELITKKESHDTLTSLAEVSFYRHSKLFDDVVVSSAFTKILDEARGAKLATGSVNDRTAVLRQMLPEVPAEAWTGGVAPTPTGGGRKGGGFFGGLFGGGDK
ncbi:MAG: hypothetical protein VB878_17295 [Pirellulaceae bacterium]